MKKLTSQQIEEKFEVDLDFFLKHSEEFISSYKGKLNLNTKPEDLPEPFRDDWVKFKQYFSDDVNSFTIKELALSPYGFNAGKISLLLSSLRDNNILDHKFAAISPYTGDISLFDELKDIPIDLVDKFGNKFNGRSANVAGFFIRKS